mgnify:FL=1
MSQDEPVSNLPQKAARKRSLLEMSIFTLAMFGFGFAFAPLYGALCQLTGLNGRSEGMLVASSLREAPDLSRTVSVQFLTVVNGGREWQFRPEQSEIKVHPGQFATVNFVAENMLDEDVVGQAVPAVTPGKAVKHVKKTECFCFTQQAFKAREKKIMPVRLMLDPDLPKDLNTVTLSYTFFDVTELEQQSAKPKS